MKKLKQLSPPKIDWNKVTRGECLQLPIGTMTEYSFPKNIKKSLAQLNGKYPWDAEWSRNTEVDEWYLILRGGAEVTIEGRPTRELKAGDSMYFPKGTWYKSIFRNAVLEIPSIPVWTYEQSEQK